jgi:TIR domain
MPDGPGKPVIFISYSHKDEPDLPRDGEVRWLSEIQSYLSPAVKHGCSATYELWDDRQIAGGSGWRGEIEGKLATCTICILLLSRHSLDSDFVLKVEVETIQERQRRGENVQLFPIVLSRFPEASVPAFLLSLQLRPGFTKPLSGMLGQAREEAISQIVDEIIKWLCANPVAPLEPILTQQHAVQIDITDLPETGYERLVGRDAELERLGAAWADPAVNIISLVAEGGAGKSALVNEWLKHLRPENYRGAQAVLGWSFYSQGTKERATSADLFFDWALAKLDLTVEGIGATVKAKAIAEALRQRRVLLVLDGVEPLQHGPDGQQGQLKDPGLRELLRHFATTPPGAPHGLIVLTSRLAVKDIARWQSDAAPIIEVWQLSDKAGAELLRDNGIWGTDKELRAASHDFGGHPLALELLAGYLNEAQKGDVRRRDRIRGFMADSENPRHDHARRVMESYEKEWLSGHAELLAIMYLVGLFERPASAECLEALRAKPMIKGLTEPIVKAESSTWRRLRGRITGLDDEGWRRAVARLRGVRLLLPEDSTSPDTLDAHPLVREWFGERLQQTNEAAWKATHGRLFEFLRDHTHEGDLPTLEDLAPLFQAISHGCHAGRYQEALDQIYWLRICRKNQFYASTELGAIGSSLSAISWFFRTAFEIPIEVFNDGDESFVLNQAGHYLSVCGRLAEGMPIREAALKKREALADWPSATNAAISLATSQLLLGQLSSAINTARRSITLAERTSDEFWKVACLVIFGGMTSTAGDDHATQTILLDAEQCQSNWQPHRSLFPSFSDYWYCDLLLAKGDWTAIRKRAPLMLEEITRSRNLLDNALHKLSIGRAELGLTLSGDKTRHGEVARIAVSARGYLNQGAADLRMSQHNDFLPKCVLASSVFDRSTGDWDSATRDLNEVEEIAEPGPTRLYLCDLALERARLAFARIEAFAPLNGLLDDSPPKPEVPDAAERARLRAEAEEQIGISAKYIDECGYHRRDEELAELRDVLVGRRSFASLPVHV